MGFILQAVAGGFDFFLIHRPVNYVLAVVLLLLGLVVGRARNNAIARWLVSVPFSVAIIGAFLVLACIMGLVPQGNWGITGPDQPANLLVRLGFTGLTRSWPLALLYSLLLVSLAGVTARRFTSFSANSVLFLCLHGGLFLALLGAGLGAADIQRHVMHVQERATEWRVYSDDGEILELPIAIELHDFDIEGYPPKLAIVDKDAGIPLPEGRPEWLQIEEKRPQGRLGDYAVTIDEYIHDAVWAGGGVYKEMWMPGSSPAVRLTALNRKTGQKFAGWVSGGTMSQFMSSLPLSDNLAVVMAQPEPKRFVSDITVMTADGYKERLQLEVNSPLRLGAWMVYQYGYDNRAGRLSTYSSFELVYDPWLPAVYCGLALMGAGAIMLVWRGKRKKGGAV